jgi:hypothetical protein
MCSESCQPVIHYRPYNATFHFMDGIFFTFKKSNYGTWEVLSLIKIVLSSSTLYKSLWYKELNHFKNLLFRRAPLVKKLEVISR